MAQPVDHSTGSDAPHPPTESWDQQQSTATATEKTPADSKFAKKNRASVRMSTYSVAPSVTPTFQTDNSAHNEIRDIAHGLDRMENKALSSQRVVLSEEKTDNMSKLALGAKLERALDRRMSSQDAEMRPRGKSLNNALAEKLI